MSHNMLEAYQEIIGILKLAHKDKPFGRHELDNLFLQELDVIREGTQAAHIKTMISLGLIEQATMGTAYQEAKYRVGPKGLGATLD